MTDFRDRSEFSKHIEGLDKKKLTQTLSNIFERLHCDEEGRVAEGESTAANSAADFVESCTCDLERLEYAPSVKQEHAKERRLELYSGIVRGGLYPWNRR